MDQHYTPRERPSKDGCPAMLAIVCEDGTSYDYLLSGKRVSIGRGRDNDLVLPESGISRRHAEIVATSLGHEIFDLGSGNGTLVNGTTISRIMLSTGDVIGIGSNKIIYRASNTQALSEAAPQQVVAASSSSDASGSRTLLISVEKSGSAVDAGDAKPSKPSQNSVEATARDLTEILSALERSNKVLFVLYEISSQLHVIHDFNALLQKIMDLVFEVIDADYGFIMLAGSDDAPVTKPVVVKCRDQRHNSIPSIRPSRTIIRRVIRDKVALLTTNAMDDSRFDAARSILLRQIRSAMCVPLWKKDAVIGVIQIHSIRRENLFSQEELELLKAIGSQVSMIIEQASLNAKIREEERMRRQLERFHSPQVVEMILRTSREGQETIMEPREVTATILFSDIIGFTSLSERLPARKITAILNCYFSKMTDIVFRYGGTLDKYIGDGLMAVFGAPIEKDDDARRAVRAAVEMRDVLADLRDETGAPLPFQVRIGINTGPIVSGNIGSLRRMEYTVIGDPVNMASRLESMAQPNQILIGEETFLRVKDSFRIHAVGPRKVKGKASEIMVYEVLLPGI